LIIAQIWGLGLRKSRIPGDRQVFQTAKRPAAHSGRIAFQAQTGQMLEREGLKDHVIVVTRWYGGKHLGGDRFRHVQDCVRHYLDNT